MEQFNQNKKGTCKCIDYFKKDGSYYVKKELKKTNQDVKCNRKTKNGKHFCSKHKHCKKFHKKIYNGNESEYDPIVRENHILYHLITVILIF